MNYEQLMGRLKRGDVVLLDGGTGTELERRGVVMDPKAWCGPATIDNVDIREGIHRDYIDAGATIITANTYSCSPMMLEFAGVGDQFETITRTAIDTARRARDKSGRTDVVIAGSLSHVVPRTEGQAMADFAPTPPHEELRDAFARLTRLFKEAGCDVVLAEMMFRPDRIRPALEAAADCGLPLWVGLAARRGEDGDILSFSQQSNIPFAELVQLINEFKVDAAGIMHTQSNTIADALDILSAGFDGPLMAYPDPGYFTMPSWNFEDIIPPEELAEFAAGWTKQGAQIIGGCCGLGPEHIRAVAPLALRSV